MRRSGNDRPTSAARNARRASVAAAQRRPASEQCNAMSADAHVAARRPNSSSVPVRPTLPQLRSAPPRARCRRARSSALRARANAPGFDPGEQDTRQLARLSSAAAEALPHADTLDPASTDFVTCCVAGLEQRRRIAVAAHRFTARGQLRGRSFDGGSAASPHRKMPQPFCRIAPHRSRQVTDARRLCRPPRRSARRRGGLRGRLVVGRFARVGAARRGFHAHRPAAPNAPRYARPQRGCPPLRRYVRMIRRSFEHGDRKFSCRRRGAGARWRV